MGSTIITLNDELLAIKAKIGIVPVAVSQANL
jgi:hypothetical protein